MAINHNGHRYHEERPRTPPGTSSLLSTVLAHRSKYPGMGVQDVAKLVFQATLGCEHAVKDVTTAVKRLHKECESLAEGFPEPLVERLGEDGQFVRLHLRPAQLARLEPDRIAMAFVESARTLVPRARLESAVAELEAGFVGEDRAELLRFLESWRDDGYLAVHHTSAYRELYQPAYRVLELSVAHRLVSDLLSTR